MKVRGLRREGLCLLSLLVTLCGFPRIGAAGETAAFLKILPGARPMAMGGAFSAVADDLNALATNPAGLSQMSMRQAAFMHAELFDDTHYDFIGYAHPIAGNISILGGGIAALGLQRLSHGSLQGRDVNRQPTGSFGASDTAFNLAYSRKIPGLTSLFGTNIKIIDSQLADASAQTVAMDVGVLSPEVHGLPLTVGASVNNLGPGLKFASETNNLPLSFSVGGAVNVIRSLLISADIHHRPYSHLTSFGIGSEYTLLPIFSLRAGYAVESAQAQPISGTSGFISGLNGLGMGFGFKIQKATLDYSFSPSGELGNAHRLSISSRF